MKSKIQVCPSKRARGRAAASPACPCCKLTIHGDVWYDCRCFQGGKKTCATCNMPKAEQDAAIAATMRAWGWDKQPSPGMRDYLTPGWRPAYVPAPPSVVDVSTFFRDPLEDADGIPY